MTSYSIYYKDGETNASLIFDRDDIREVLKSLIEVMSLTNTQVINNLSITQITGVETSEKKRSNIK